MKFLILLCSFLSIASATQKTGSHNLVAIEDKDEVFCEFDEDGCEKDGSNRLNVGNTDNLLEDDFMGMVEDFPSFAEEGDVLDSAVDWPESSLLLETGAEAEVEYDFPFETVTLQFDSEDSEDWPEEPNYAETLAGEPVVYDKPVETVFVELEEEESENAAETDSVLLEYEITEISNMDANLMETNAEPEMDYSEVTESVLVESDNDLDESGEMDANLEETGAGEYFETVQPDVETVSTEVDSSDIMEMDSNMEATGAEEPLEFIEPVTETEYVEMEDTDTSDVDSNLQATGAEEILYDIDSEGEISLVEMDDEAPLDPNLEETGAVIDSTSAELEE